MFCPECGKEVKDGNKFCLFCGYNIKADYDELSGGGNTEDVVNEQITVSSEKSIVNQQTVEKASNDNTETSSIANNIVDNQKDIPQVSYDAVHMITDEESFISVLVTIGKILSFLLCAFFAYVFFMDFLRTIVNGDPDLREHTGEMLAAILFFVGGIIYTYFEIIRGTIAKRKRYYIVGFLEEIAGTSVKTIYEMLNSSSCPVIKDARYNEYENCITITGNKNQIVELKQDNEGKLKFEQVSGKENIYFKSMIIVFLARQIPDYQGLDKYKVYKNSKFLRIGEIISVSAFVAGFVIFVYLKLFAPAMSAEDYIEVVRDTYLEGHSVTCGKAFDEFFERGTWEDFVSDDGTNVIQYTGFYGEEKCTIQWVCKKDTQMGSTKLSAELYTFLIDEEPMSYADGQSLIIAILDEVENKSASAETGKNSSVEKTIAPTATPVPTATKAPTPTPKPTATPIPTPEEISQDPDYYKKYNGTYGGGEWFSMNEPALYLKISEMDWITGFCGDIDFGDRSGYESYPLYYLGSNAFGFYSSETDVDYTFELTDSDVLTMYREGYYYTTYHCVYHE